MKLGIMQPYFLPYIGYFQLINVVDQFVLYDSLEYTKKGWINRNRILVNGNDDYITLPIKKDSDYLNINERFLSESWKLEKTKLLNRINAVYKKAPFFENTFKIIIEIFSFENTNLYHFLSNSISSICSELEITTPIIPYSQIMVSKNYKKEELVIEICKRMNSTNYYNSIGGVNLYNKDKFKENGIEINFIESEKIIYNQFNHNFIPSLSIIDVMMFNSIEQIRLYLNRYKVI